MSSSRRNYRIAKCTAAKCALKALKYSLTTQCCLKTVLFKGDSLNKQVGTHSSLLFFSYCVYYLDQPGSDVKEVEQTEAVAAPMPSLGLGLTPSSMGITSSQLSSLAQIASLTGANPQTIATQAKKQAQFEQEYLRHLIGGKYRRSFIFVVFIPFYIRSSLFLLHVYQHPAESIRGSEAECDVHDLPPCQADDKVQEQAAAAASGPEEEPEQGDGSVLQTIQS